MYILDNKSNEGRHMKATVTIKIVWIWTRAPYIKGKEMTFY